MSPHVHDFDPLSGWCRRCTYRDDGRLIGSVHRKPGAVFRPGSTEQSHDERHDQ